MDERSGLGGEARGPRGPGASFGMSAKFRERAGSEVCAGRGEHGARRVVEVNIEVCGECDGEE